VSSIWKTSSKSVTTIRALSVVTDQRSGQLFQPTIKLCNKHIYQYHNGLIIFTIGKIDPILLPIIEFRVDSYTVSIRTFMVRAHRGFRIYLIMEFWGSTSGQAFQRTWTIASASSILCTCGLLDTPLIRF
jgi:hypothetical protein